jgi:hypothetical protein
VLRTQCIVLRASYGVLGGSTQDFGRSTLEDAILNREWLRVLAELFALLAEVDERAEAPEH